MRRVLENPGQFSNELSTIAHRSRELLVYDTGSDANEIRSRGYDLFKNMLEATTIKMEEWKRKWANVLSSEIPAIEQDYAQKLAMLADRIGDQIYFVSDAALRNGEVPLALEVKNRLWSDVQPLLHILVNHPYPPLVHRLNEAIISFYDIDPMRVLLWIQQIMNAGKLYGYQYDSFAESLVPPFIEKFLGEQKQLLKEEPSCIDAIIDILGIFTEVGWQSAFRLTYRLEEVYK